MKSCLNEVWRVGILLLLHWCLICDAHRTRGLNLFGPIDPPASPGFGFNLPSLGIGSSPPPSGVSTGFSAGTAGSSFFNTFQDRTRTSPPRKGPSRRPPGRRSPSLGQSFPSLSPNGGNSASTLLQQFGTRRPNGSIPFPDFNNVLQVPNVSVNDVSPPLVTTPPTATTLSPILTTPPAATTLPPILTTPPATTTLPPILTTPPTTTDTPPFDPTGGGDDEDLEEGELIGGVDPAVEGVDTNIPEAQRRETVLRNNVLTANLQAAAAEIAAIDIVTSGFGLRVNDAEDRPFRTENRNQDPDVVAFKALAIAALDLNDPNKTANAVAVSFMDNCQCDPFVSEEYAAIIDNFVDAFSDQAFLREAIKTDVNTVNNQRRRRRKRRLLQAEKAPTNSFVCAGCWPGRTCKVFSWCG